MSILVIDVGTSGVRAAIVRARRDRRPRALPRAAARLPAPRPRRVRRRRASATRPSIWRAQALAAGGPVDAVGITNQRASTIVWDRATGEPVGPGLGWQDLRTVGECLVLPGRGPAPRARTSRPPSSRTCSTTLRPRPRPRPVLRHRRHVDRLDAVRRRRRTSPTCRNAAVTGLIDLDGTGWDDARARRAAHPRGDAAARSSTRPASIGEATALAGRAADRRHRRRPAGVADRPGLRRARAWPRSPSAPAACSTSCVGPDRPRSTPAAAAARSRSSRGAAAARSRGASRRSCCRPAPTSSGCATTSASSPPAAESARRRRRRATTPTASCTCPRCSGSGTPQWDYGARGTLLGLTRGAGPPAGRAGRARGRRPPGRRPGRGGRGRRRHLTHRGAAHRRRHEPATRPSSRRWPTPPSDRSRSRPWSRPPRSAPPSSPAWPSARGSSLDDIAATWRPTATVEPGAAARPGPLGRRGRRAGAWFPELSGLDF